MKYAIREVDGEDEDVVEVLDEMHRICFGNSAPVIDHTNAAKWWFAYEQNDTPVAFAGLVHSLRYSNAGYLYRAGVLPYARGQGLQRRLVRVREKAARNLGYEWLVSDTTDGLHSANNLIACGYKLYEPKWKYAFKTTLYWCKYLNGVSDGKTLDAKGIC